MARRRATGPTLAAVQAAVAAADPSSERFLKHAAVVHEAGRVWIERGEWDALLELRAWAREQPLFAGPRGGLYVYLRRWEEALVSGAPLAVAASLVRDDVATEVPDACDRLGARATWAELRPLLRDDAAAWAVAEARVLRGETLPGRSPVSGMPLQMCGWEARPDLPFYSPSGVGWSSYRFAGALGPTRLPAAPAELVYEAAWDQVVLPWAVVEPRFAKVVGGGLAALACLLGEGAEPDVGSCTAKEAMTVLLHAHGNAAPYLPGLGMVAARRAVWRLFAELAELAWPPSDEALQAAMTEWRWSRYDPHEEYADPSCWSVFLVLEDPRRGLAWAAYAWVTD